MTTPTPAPTAVTPDPVVPAFHITREFLASPAQLMRAHTDPELFVRWIGPNAAEVTLDYWDARTGGSWRFVDRGHGFHGCFHEVSPTRIVQTFTWEGMPDQVSLETLTLTDLGDGRTRVQITSLVESFEARDGWLASGMEGGVDEGYAKLDALLAAGAPELTEYRHTADRFGEVVAGVTDWDAPTPVAEWRARDVVGHLTTWLPGLLSSSGIDLAVGDHDRDDPAAAWRALDTALRTLLTQDPERPFSHPMAGEGTMSAIVARLFTPDVFLHTWDLARASGQADRLDDERSTAMLEGMRSIEPMLRASGQFGVQQPEPHDADPTDRLIAFVGRDPRWAPPV